MEAEEGGEGTDIEVVDAVVKEVDGWAGVLSEELRREGWESGRRRDAQPK